MRVDLLKSKEVEFLHLLECQQHTQEEAAKLQPLKGISLRVVQLFSFHKKIDKVYYFI